MPASWAATWPRDSRLQLQPGHSVQAAQFGQQPPHRPGLGQLVESGTSPPAARPPAAGCGPGTPAARRSTGRPSAHPRSPAPAAALRQVAPAAPAAGRTACPAPSPDHRRQAAIRVRAAGRASSPASPLGSSPAHLGGPELPDQLPQRRGERRVRQARRTQVHASPGQHPRLAPHLGSELADQPRLAAAGLRTDQHQLRHPRRRDLESVPERAELGLPANQDRAHPAAGHTPSMPAAHAQQRTRLDAALPQLAPGIHRPPPRPRPDALMKAPGSPAPGFPAGLLG